MQCQKCGYMMTAFDKTCPRCPQIQQPQIPMPPQQAASQNPVIMEVPVGYSQQMPPQYQQGYPQHPPVVIIQQTAQNNEPRKPKLTAFAAFGITFAGFGIAFAIIVFLLFLSLCMIILSSCSSSIRNSERRVNQASTEIPKQIVPTKTNASYNSYNPPTAQRPVKDASAHRAEFLRALSNVEGMSDWIKQVGRGLDEDDLLIVVSSNWHYQPRQMRLQMAQALWKIWAGIHSPKEPDKAKISLKDMMGNRVGGSGIMGGSLVHVD